MTTQSINVRGMELLMAYSQNPSIELRNQLVRLNSGLVKKTVGHNVDHPVTLGDMLPDSYDQTLQHWEEDRQQLQGAIAQLETKTQAAIEFVFFRDLPRKEAAKHIGVSPMTVTRHLQRGINELVSLLQPQTPERLAS